MTIWNCLKLSSLRLVGSHYKGILFKYDLSRRSQQSTSFLVNPGLSITKQTSHFYWTYEGSELQPYPLTKVEALAFLQFNLGIDNVLDRYRGNPESLLNKIAKRLRETVPYSTAYMFSFPLDQISDVTGKYHIMSGHGGGCGAVNPFTNAMLRNIGYKTREIVAYNPRLGDEVEYHISTMVYDVSFPGSKHLIEPGTRRPLLQSIPLDFESESPIYKLYDMRNKFFKKDGLLFWGTKVPQTVLASLEDVEIMKDEEGNEWHIVLVYRLDEQENARIRYNKFCQKVLKGEQPIPKAVSTFVLNAFLGEKLVTVIGTRETVTVTSVDKNGKTETNNIDANDLKNYFATNFRTLSWQHLLDKIIAANYQYMANMTLLDQNS